MSSLRPEDQAFFDLVTRFLEAVDFFGEHYRKMLRDNFAFLNALAAQKSG